MISLLAVVVEQRFTQSPTVSPPLAKTIVKPSYKLVLTQPLPASAVISTRTFSANPLFVTAGTVVEISTASDGFRVINDHQLLALLSDKPAVLIRTGPHSEELVFADPEDQKKFLNY